MQSRPYGELSYGDRGAFSRLAPRRAPAETELSRATQQCFTTAVNFVAYSSFQQPAPLPLMEQKHESASRAAGGAFFYGWYIVAVGILVNIAGTFAFSSTLSIFLKPITEELGVSRGAFSLIRTFEIGIAALVVPLLGSWIDRYGGRGVLVLGVLMEGAGLFLSGLAQSFWQFVLVRCSLVIAGEALLGSLDHGPGRTHLGLPMAREASTSMMMPNLTSIR